MASPSLSLGSSLIGTTSTSTSTSISAGSSSGLGCTPSVPAPGGCCCGCGCGCGWGGGCVCRCRCGLSGRGGGRLGFGEEELVVLLDLGVCADRAVAARAVGQVGVVLAARGGEGEQRQRGGRPAGEEQQLLAAVAIVVWSHADAPARPGRVARVLLLVCAVVVAAPDGERLPVGGPLDAVAPNVLRRGGQRRRHAPQSPSRCLSLSLVTSIIGLPLSVLVRCCHCVGGVCLRVGGVGKVVPLPLPVSVSVSVSVPGRVADEEDANLGSDGAAGACR
mmetsp:Transcript_5886/g.14084  ORF Transcript_5886/g.14084 Transcript_5886/m.14084 type:complete len:277 (+) Transcript_5886:261-1091(+)